MSSKMELFISICIFNVYCLRHEIRNEYCYSPCAKVPLEKRGVILPTQRDLFEELTVFNESNPSQIMMA
jgi:hypothetical protein